MWQRAWLTCGKRFVTAYGTDGRGKEGRAKRGSHGHTEKAVVSMVWAPRPEKPSLTRHSILWSCSLRLRLTLTTGSRLGSVT